MVDVARGARTGRGRGCPVPARPLRWAFARARRVACVVCGAGGAAAGGPRCRRDCGLPCAARRSRSVRVGHRGCMCILDGRPRGAACAESAVRGRRGVLSCSVLQPCPLTFGRDRSPDYAGPAGCVRCIYIEQRAARTTNTHGHIATVVWPRMRMLVRGKYTPHARATRQVAGRREAGSHRHAIAKSRSSAARHGKRRPASMRD